MKIQLFSLGTVMLGAIIVLQSCSKDDTTGSGKLSYQVKPSNFTASVSSSLSSFKLSVINVSGNTK